MSYKTLAEQYAEIEYAPCGGDLRPKHSQVYQFPATRFVSNSPWRQWWHLLSEVIEIGKALLSGDLQHAASETWDAKQSSETLHRILSGRGADVEMAQQTVIANNLDRGYYL